MTERSVVADHEAAHAVMGRLRGYPAREIWIDENNNGLCRLAGAPIDPESAVFIALAGAGSENWEATSIPFADLSANLARLSAEDFDKARRVIGHTSWLRSIVRDGQLVELSVDDAMAFHFLRAWDLLVPHIEAIDALATQLEWDGAVSGDDIESLLRGYMEEQ